MTDDLKKTIRVRLPKAAADDDSPAPDTEVELISTQELYVLLESDADRRKDLETIAEGKDGILTRNVGSDRFEIVDESEIAAALASAEDSRPLDVTSTELAELTDEGEPAQSLVSTMMLKRMLGPDGDIELFVESDKNTDRKK